jgi:ubiquinone/menaquinone biosynthesis C-methylase UbiE
MRKRLYDPRTNRLLYFDRQANEEFWDDKWRAAAEVTFANPPRHRFTVNTMRRYLEPGSRVLEGGCGLGDIVHAFHAAGYRVTGLDFAPQVVQEIKTHWPHLDIVQGDVRQLPYEDGHYDGYWSIGVIEHFPDGYDAIAREMQRVLRVGGYLFLSFPCFNRFRRARASAGNYPKFSPDMAMDDFFQYALDPSDVQATFESLGFRLVHRKGISALLALTEDSSLAAAMQRALDRFPPRIGTAVSMALDYFIGRYAGHSCLLILRKI